ncbi:MAG: hypothetical protein ABIQ18_27645, partial [Umezawaea sp.]
MGERPLVVALVGPGERQDEVDPGLSERIGDTLGQAGVHFILALASTHQGDDQRALTHVTSARDLYRQVGDSR